MKPFIVMAAIFVTVYSAHGQGAPEEETRLKIGLALSGGGARGMAHLGVLFALEELRVPVDAISGTSMGAVVGGLYAAGVPSKKLKAYLLETDWPSIFRDKPIRRERPFRHRRDGFIYLIDLDLGMRGLGFTYPRGLVQGQKLMATLQALTFPFAAERDFNQLSIPFRAVAANIVNGEMAILDKGNLARAIRASMSVPAIMEPVRYEGQLLVDGGIVDNLPVDVTRDMGVDILIAVDSSDFFEAEDALDGSLTIIDQAATVLMRRETTRQIESLTALDVFIQPDLKEFKSTDFDLGETLIEAGYQAAMAKAGELRRYSLSEHDWCLYIDARRPVDHQEPTISNLIVNNDSSLDNRFLLGLTDIRPGNLVNGAQLAADLTEIYSYDQFELVDYDLVFHENRHDLFVNTRSKSWGPNFLKFGLGMEEDFHGESDYSVRAALIKTQINPLGAEWRVGGRIGKSPFYGSRFYQPLDYKDHLYLEVFADFRRRDIPVTIENVVISEVDNDTSRIGASLGHHFGKKMDMQLGTAYVWDSFKERVGFPILEDIELETLSFFSNFTYDTLDKPYLARRGAYLRFEYRYLELQSSNNESDVPLFEAGVDVAELIYNRIWALGKYSVALGLEAGTTLDDRNAANEVFFLGGLFRLSGYRERELFGSHAGLARVMVYRQVMGNTSDRYNRGLYVGASLEAGNTWFDRDAIDSGGLLTSGSVWAGMDTFVGPIFLGVGISEDDVTYTLSIGRTLGFGGSPL